MTSKEITQQQRANKAREMRYKKPIMKLLNLSDIQNALYEMEEDCDAVTYAMTGADAEDLLAGVMNDDDEVYAFKSAFSDLSAELMRMQEDMNEMEQYYEIPEVFDTLFAACCPKGETMLGYDIVEGDYFGMNDFEQDLGREEAAKKLERLTKKEIIEATQKCFKIAFQYLGLQARYQDLKAAIDIIKGTNVEVLNGVKGIEEMHAAWFGAVAEGYTHPEYHIPPDIERKWRNMLDMMPQEVWLQ